MGKFEKVIAVLFILFLAISSYGSIRQMMIVDQHLDCVGRESDLSMQEKCVKTDVGSICTYLRKDRGISNP